MKPTPDIAKLLKAAGCTGSVEVGPDGQPFTQHDSGSCPVHEAEPKITYLPNGDRDSMYSRVQIDWGNGTVFNVGENWVEWGSPKSGGMDGCEVELHNGHGFLCRFQESSRHLIVDNRGFRVYDADTENPDNLILELTHDDYYSGHRPTLGPAAFYGTFPDTNDSVEASKGFGLSYRDFINGAAGLVSEDGENPEYDRALYELGARLFGVIDMPTDDRASHIEADIRSALAGRFFV